MQIDNFPMLGCPCQVWSTPATSRRELISNPYWDHDDPGRPGTRCVGDAKRTSSRYPWNLDFDIDDSGHTDKLTFVSAGSELYAASYFSVVTESRFKNSAESLSITEKVCKALVNMHPMLVVGNSFLLRELRRLGFRSFSRLIDERYDEIHDPAGRMWALFHELDRLCALDMRTLHDIYVEMLPDLLHNRDLMLHYAERQGRSFLASLDHRSRSPTA